jgi:hypothetical protein
MQLANKFFSDSTKGKVFRKYCEDVGIRMDMTIEEMRTSIRDFHEGKIRWASFTKNEEKDIFLPKIEEEIARLKKDGLDAIPKFGHRDFDTLDWTGKPKTFTVSNDTKHIHSHSWRSVKEQKPNKVSFVIDDWTSLSKQMKKDFWRMQYTILKYDRFLHQKELEKAKKQIAYSKRVIQKLDRLSEEEVKIYYREVVEAKLDKSENC